MNCSPAICVDWLRLLAAIALVLFLLYGLALLIFPYNVIIWTHIITNNDYRYLKRFSDAGIKREDYSEEMYKHLYPGSLTINRIIGITIIFLSLVCIIEILF